MQATFNYLFTIYDPYTHQAYPTIALSVQFKSGSTVPLRKVKLKRLSIESLVHVFQGWY
jgi:hypothetical protein